jgi:hypothetical protein
MPRIVIRSVTVTSTCSDKCTYEKHVPKDRA